MNSISGIAYKLSRKGIRRILFAVYYKALRSIAIIFSGKSLSILKMKLFHFCAAYDSRQSLHTDNDSESNANLFKYENDLIAEIIPYPLKRETLESAEKLMSSMFIFKGRVHQFQNSIDWFFEPDGNKGWRWDLNRHFFLITLAKAYVYSKKPKYLHRIEQILTDWCKRNPVSLRCSNWNEPFEVAARMGNWIWLLYLLKNSNDIAKGLTSTLLKGIQQHASYLFRFMEIHIPNNHLLLESKALYHAYMVFSHNSTAIKWLHKALKYLIIEVQRQVKNDGGHSEQSITYQRIINSELWETYLLMTESNANLDFLPQFKKTLLAMTEFLRSMMRPDGSFPLIGDASSVDTYYRFNPFMFAAAVLGRPDFKSAAVMLGEDDLTYFALGAERAVKYKRMEQQLPLVLASAFSDSGYYVMRDESLGLHALIDCGPFCDEIIPAHGHDDILNLDLSLNGSRLLVDGGNDSLPFDAPDAHLWRKYFRGAKSHNVLLLDDRNRSHLDGYSDVLRVASAVECNWHEDKNLIYFSGAHDGYLNSFGIVHQRKIILMKGEFMCVLDSLSGDGSHGCEILYHLAPDKRAVVNEQVVDVLDRQRRIAQLAFFGILGDISIAHGDIEPIQGWVSFQAGTRIQTDTISFKTISRLPLYIGTLIQPHKINLFNVELVECHKSRPCEAKLQFALSGRGMQYWISSGFKLIKSQKGPGILGSHFMISKKAGRGSSEILFKTEQSPL